MPLQADSLSPHLQILVTALRQRRVVLFLGAGVNRCGRTTAAKWRSGECLPDGGELATHLARTFAYPVLDSRDLVRISQYVSIMAGSGPLYDELHSIFDADYPPTAVHELIARLPGYLSRPGSPGHLLVVTTNYDDVMECALRRTGEAFDVVTFAAVGSEAGKFVHVTPEGRRHVIEDPNAYIDVSCEHRTVVLKLHGAIDRAAAGNDSFVITEDDYIDFLAHADIGNLLPVRLAARMQRSHFLFLGYSLRDWNLRVLLRRIWGEQRLRYNSWAVQWQPDELDQRFWKNRNVDILDLKLEDYAAALSQRLEEEAADEP